MLSGLHKRFDDSRKTLTNSMNVPESSRDKTQIYYLTTWLEGGRKESRFRSLLNGREILRSAGALPGSEDDYTSNSLDINSYVLSKYKTNSTTWLYFFLLLLLFFLLHTARALLNFKETSSTPTIQDTYTRRYNVK